MDNKQERQKAYIHNAIQAWFATRFEYDKSILYLSSGGIVLLSTMIKEISNWTEFAIMILGMISFLISIGATLFVFTYNSRLIEDHLDDADTGNSSKKLAVADKVNRIAFIHGVVFAIILAIYIGSVVIIKKNGGSMADNNQNKTQINEVHIDRVEIRSDNTALRESVNGMGKLAAPKPAEPAPPKDNGSNNSQ